MRVPILCLFLTVRVMAQTPPQASPPPAAVLSDPGWAYSTYGYANVFAGPLVATGGSATKLAGTAGITVGEFQVKPLKKGVGMAPELELGIIGPIPNGHNIDGLASINAQFANELSRHDIFPFLTGGLSRIFLTGSALNFGIGFEHSVRGSDTVVRFELRDYYLSTGPQQHLISLRVALGTIISDN